MQFSTLIVIIISTCVAFFGTIMSLTQILNQDLEEKKN